MLSSKRPQTVLDGLRRVTRNNKITLRTNLNLQPHVTSWVHTLTYLGYVVPVTPKVLVIIFKNLFVFFLLFCLKFWVMEMLWKIKDGARDKVFLVRKKE